MVQYNHGATERHTPSTQTQSSLVVCMYVVANLRGTLVGGKYVCMYMAPVGLAETTEESMAASFGRREANPMLPVRTYAQLSVVSLLPATFSGIDVLATTTIHGGTREVVFGAIVLLASFYFESIVPVTLREG